MKRIFSVIFLVGTILVLVLPFKGVAEFSFSDVPFLQYAQKWISFAGQR